MAVNKGQIIKRVLVSQAFSPSAPVDKQSLFAGRLNQVNSVISAVYQRGQHVIIFGERGVGKTSLATVLFDFLSQAGLSGLDCGTINCDATMNFSSLWHKIFRDISIFNEKNPTGFTEAPVTEKFSLDSVVPDVLTPDDVRFVLRRLTQQSVIILDEFDRIEDEETTTLVADTIKTLSDHSVNTTLILVGVADSVNELIAKHQSVERALVQIHMPRMSGEELSEALDKSLAQIPLGIDHDAKEFIVRLSKGLPHYTHVLGQQSGYITVADERDSITKNDVEEAIKVAVNHGQQSIISAYHAATTSPRGNLYKEVLLACALAETDELGFFSAKDVREPMTAIMGKKYDIPHFAQHLAAFCGEDRNVLQRVGTPKRYRFRFINPLLQPFVIMRGIEDGLIESGKVACI